MSVTLQAIWKIPPRELQTILQRNGYDFTDNINYDRALVAQILFNEDELKEEWVAHPQFLEAMSATSSLEEGLQTLREPFQLRLLHLYGSLAAARDAAWVAAGDAAGVAAGDAAWGAAGDAAYVAAYGAAGDAVGDAAYVAVRNAVRNAAQLPGVTPQTIGRAAAEAAWKVVIEKDGVIEGKISEIKLEKKDFQPSKIYERLLGVDVSLMIPRARCFYLYSLWELLQLVPNETYEGKLQTLLVRYECLGPFEPEYPLDVAEPHLVKALGPLLLEYVGVPPRLVIMQRLLAI